MRLPGRRRTLRPSPGPVGRQAAACASPGARCPTPAPWRNDRCPVPVPSVSAAPHSDKVHEIERIRRISPTQIEDVMTIEDPVAFTKPWVVTRRYDLKPTWDIQEYVCEDNNRNPIKSDGTTETGVVAAQHVETKSDKPLARR